MSLIDGGKVYTKSSTNFVSNGKSGLDVTYETQVTGMKDAPAQEGVFFLPNGGAYFYLPKKFEITKEDVDNAVNFKIVMAFDPDGMIKGETYVEPSSVGLEVRHGMSTCPYDDQEPFLPITAVLRSPSSGSSTYFDGRWP